MNGTVIQLKTSISKPFAGMFANFEDPPEESKDYTVQAYPIMWAFLAKYSASQADKDFIDSITKRATIQIDGRQYYFALMNVYHAIFHNALVKRDFDRAIEAGIKYAKLLVVLPDYKESRGDLWKINDPVDLDDLFKKTGRDFFTKWSECICGLIVEPMMMFICISDELPALDFSKWLVNLIGIFGEKDKAVKSVKWLEKVVSSVFGDEAAIEEIREDTRNSSDQSEHTRRLSILAMCVSKHLQLSEVLSAQFSVLKTMMHPMMESSHWAIFFYNMVVKRWTFLAENQRCFMISPKIWSEKILSAISFSSPTAKDIAKILLLVGEATGIRWPGEMLSELRQVSQ